jgi:hypothetical protein
VEDKSDLEMTPSKEAVDALATMSPHSLRNNHCADILKADPA